MMCEIFQDSKVKAEHAEFSKRADDDDDDDDGYRPQVLTKTDGDNDYKRGRARTCPRTHGGANDGD